MLKLDQMLLQESNGKTGEQLEQAITKLSIKQHETPHIFGEIIPLDVLLVSKREAKNVILTIVQKYWGSVDLFTHRFFRDSIVDIDTANDKIHSFLSSPQGKKAIFDYLLIHNVFNFKSLIGIIFGKTIETSKPVGGLDCIYLYKINKKYFIHIMYDKHVPFWNMLFLKKVYSIFIQVEIEQIQHVVHLMGQFHLKLHQQYTKSQSITITNKLIQYIDFQNTRSFLLKGLHLFNIAIHFNGGKRHYNKVRKMILEAMQSWSRANWVITDKEQTFLTYLLIIDAYQNEEIEQTIEYGQQLIKKERLNDHAVELLLEFSDILPNLKPEPKTIVKQYDKNFLEQIFFILIDALVQKECFVEVISLLKDYEIASCKAIYNYFNIKPFNDDLLHQVEATVQRDIAFIVDHSLHHVSASIETWLTQYKQCDRYIHISEMTSKHVCNLLKSLFATHHYDLFEKLMEIYNKYLKLDDDFNDLKQFISTFVTKD